MSVRYCVGLVFFICAVYGVSAQTEAAYCPGLMVDGVADEWDSCDTPERTMTMVQPAGIPTVPNPGEIVDGIRFRFAHDGVSIFILAIVRAPYFLDMTAGDNHVSHSFGIMWRIGENATAFNMGGCPVDSPPGASGPYDCEAFGNFCSSQGCNQDCSSYLVDVWAAETGRPGALPGVTYPYRGPIVFNNSDGTYSSLGYDIQGLGMYQPVVEHLYRGDDVTENVEDELSVHPCLRGDDGSDDLEIARYRLDGRRYGNQLRWAWSHSAINSYEYPFGPIGEDGFYVYEFSRPLITNENTDAQFRVGENAFFSFGFFNPPAAGERWPDDSHYVAPPDLTFGSVRLLSQPWGNAADHVTSINLMALILTTLTIFTVLF